MGKYAAMTQSAMTVWLNCTGDAELRAIFSMAAVKLI
jgi:hypothetical protein